MTKYIIAPSIVSADHLRLREDILACEKAGADWIHVDVMDGHFVPNITMGPFLVAAYKRATQLPLDVHLMIEHPERYIEAFTRAGASHLTVHVESGPNLYRTLQEIKSLGCTAGISLNPGTPVASIGPALQVVDLVLVMSVNPGFSNQVFMPEAVERVRQARRMLDEAKSSVYLEVDGGVTPANLGKLRNAGANAFVSANSIFSHPDGIAAGLAELRSAANSDSDTRDRPV
jgi:ribulose-phosphate 3-epimerase